MTDLSELDQIEEAIRSGEGNRDLLIEIISKGALFPPLVKTLVYAAVMQMSDQKVKEFSGYALEAIGYARNKDMDGLEKFLLSSGVPTPMVELIKPYVNRAQD